MKLNAPQFLAIIFGSVWLTYIIQKMYAEWVLVNELMAEYHIGDGLLMDKKELCLLLHDKGLHMEATQCDVLFNSVDAQGNGLDGSELGEVLHKVVDLPGLDRTIRRTVVRSRTVESKGWYADFFVLIVGLGYLYVLGNDGRVAALDLEKQLFAAGQREAGLERALASLQAEGAAEKARIEEELKDASGDRKRLEGQLQQAYRMAASASQAFQTRMRLLEACFDVFRFTSPGRYHAKGAQQGFEISVEQRRDIFGAYDPPRQDFVIYQTWSFKVKDKKENQDFLGQGMDSCFKCREIAPNAYGPEYAVKRYRVSEARQRHIASELRTCKESQANPNERLLRYEKVLECGEHLYVLMELLEGGSDLYDLLQDDVKQNKKFETWRKRYLHIFKEIVLAVHSLHTSDPPVFHNDLKRENIFVMNWENPAECTVKLIDFGMAHFRNPEDLDTGGACVDRYAPPEDPVLYDTAAADLWRLGRTLECMVSFLHENSSRAQGFAAQQVMEIRNGLKQRHPDNRWSTAQVLAHLDTIPADVWAAA